MKVMTPSAGKKIHLHYANEIGIFIPGVDSYHNKTFIAKYSTISQQRYLG